MSEDTILALLPQIQAELANMRTNEARRHAHMIDDIAALRKEIAALNVRIAELSQRVEELERRSAGSESSVCSSDQSATL
jgi:polyhydroxyalkanoate synthesis regulator phasin